MASITDTSTVIATGQVAITNAAGVQIRPTNSLRSKITLGSSVPFFMADTAAGTTTGYPPFGTNQGGIGYDVPTQDAVYARACGAPGVVYYTEYAT